MLSCNHPNCNLEVYDSESNKCIFHCEKHSWHYINLKGKYIWDKQKVKYFWEQIRLYIELLKKDNRYWTFDSFIFPDIEMSLLSIPINQKKVLLEDYYFGSKGETFKFDNFTFFNRCKFYNISFDRVLTNSLLFEKIDVVGNLSMSHMKIKSLSFSNVHTKGIIELEHLFIEENCSFHDISVGHLILWNIKTNEFTLNSCKLKKLDYTNFEFEKGLFISSEIKMLYASSEMSFSNKNKFRYLDMDVYSANRDYFRFLKSYYTDQKDFINANEMYAKEMTVYYKDTYFNLTTKCENFFQNLGTFLVLGFSKISSNFGQNWIMALSWLLIILLAFFIIGVGSFDRNEFIEFLNPFDDKYKDGKINYSLWFTHKFISSFFLYQFIMSLKRKIRY